MSETKQYTVWYIQKNIKDDEWIVASPYSFGMKLKESAISGLKQLRFMFPAEKFRIMEIEVIENHRVTED